MKKIAILFLITIIPAVFLSNCGGKEVAEIGKLATYEDVAVKFAVEHPDNWITSAPTPGQ